MQTKLPIFRNIAVLLQFGSFGLFLGCQPPATTVNKATETHSHEDHAHDHGHAHDHSEDHGPNGGHLVDLAPSQMHAEWAHDDETGKLTFYFSDFLKAGKKVESVKVNLAVQGQEEKTYDFKVTDKDTYELESLELLTAIELCSGEKDSKVSAKVVAMIDGKEESAPIVHHDHDHGHNH